VPTDPPTCGPFPARAERAPLLVLSGPTASGKTDLALELAARHGLEILSVDSMAVYRGMDVGTAKPTLEARARVPHHGLDLVDPSEDFDAARYCAHADRVRAEVAARGGRLLLVGGTPLYLMAFLRGFFEGPKADPGLREELLALERGEPGRLHAELARVDPEAAARIHRHDRKRLVRALEVHRRTGRPISRLQRQFDEGPPRHPYRGVWLSLPREVLRERVRERCRRMFEAGLVDEVRRIRAAGGFGKTAGVAIGYREVLAFLDGELPADRLVTKVRAHTHRLVRRQETWLRRFPGLVRLDLQDLTREEALERLETEFDLGPRSSGGDPR